METIRSYNKRLGRPRRAVRDGVVSKTKVILNCDSWGRYLSDLGVVVKDQQTLDHLLRFSVYNSWKKGYHKRRRDNGYQRSSYHRKPTVIDAVSRPQLQIASISEAEKANAVLFVKPSKIEKQMGWIQPISISSEPIESKSSDTPLSTRSGPRKRFNLSTINSLIAPNAVIPPAPRPNMISNGNQRPQSLSSRSSTSAFSKRRRNPINPDSDDRFSGNWRSGPRKTMTSFQDRMRNAVRPSDRFSGNVVDSSHGTASNVPFQRPPILYDSGHSF